MGSEARFVQNRVEEIAGTVTREGPASAIGAMCTRRKPECEDTRLGITERRYRSSPVFPISVGAPAHTRDFSAMRSQARTALAGYDLLIQGRERFSRGGHVKF